MSATKTKKAKAPKTSKKAAKPNAAKKREGKMSALDAAAKVLVDSGEPMTTKELIEKMAAKGLWSSPNGNTPERTLYSAILKELNAKGKESRFKNGEWGSWPLNSELAPNAPRCERRGVFYGMAARAKRAVGPRHGPNVVPILGHRSLEFQIILRRPRMPPVNAGWVPNATSILSRCIGFVRCSHV